ncbi:probable splicing factor, arginine/serine-rich 7 [Paramacrobiotus metropolitanus]|uniref:probable splicing factor, arginine/serine-rich 7 n=1 Tax=Paramacrobiotus metropolitanus TaxID=2943436 RepID=UPI00244580D7|nr:probable splicing factor, arginine/serine-rich 7 [Paramacrobiotus metropolitanus]
MSKTLKLRFLIISRNIQSRPFFQQFERAADTLSWDNDRKVKMLPNYLGEAPRRYFEGLWPVNKSYSYDQWKSVLVERFLPEDYEMIKRLELSKKVFKKGMDINQFLDEMQILFQDIDALMPEKYKIAEINRAFSDVPEYRKFLAITKTSTVSDIRSVLTKLAVVDRPDASGSESNPIEVKHYSERGTPQQYSTTQRSRSPGPYRSRSPPFYRGSAERPSQYGDRSRYRQSSSDRPVDRDRRRSDDSRDRFRSRSRDHTDTRYRHHAYSATSDRYRSGSRSRDDARYSTPGRTGYRSPSADRFGQRGRNSDPRPPYGDRYAREHRDARSDRPSGRERRSSRDDPKRIPPKFIDFDSYRLDNGKIFCPKCHDFAHSYKECPKAAADDKFRIERICPQDVKSKVQRDYDDYVQYRLSKEGNAFWATAQGKE